MHRRSTTLFCCVLLACGGEATSDTDAGVTAAGVTSTTGSDASADTVTDTDTDTNITESGLLPLFDAHAHQMPSFEDGWLDALFTEHGPRGVALLGVGNALAEQMARPDQVVAFSHLPDLEAIDHALLRTQLENGTSGIGEVSIRHFPSGPPPAEATEHDFDAPELLAVYDLAAEFGVPVNFHFDYDADQVGEITSTLPLYPEVDFVWAHAGDAQPDALRPLLAAHDNLHLDLSCRNALSSFEGRLVEVGLQRLDDEDGVLKDAWASLMTDYADRILYGSDIGPAGRLEQYAQIQDAYRALLGQLDAETARLIAHDNAIALYGLGGG